MLRYKADLLIGFCFLETQLLERKKGPKKGRNVRKIEVPTDTPTGFGLGDTASDLQERREEREQSDREVEAQKQ